MELTNLNKKAKTKWILVVVVKHRHHENGLLDNSKHRSRVISRLSEVGRSMLRHAILITRIPWVHVCELLWSPRIQIQGGSPLKKWVGIIAIKTWRTQIYFLSDVLVAIVPLDLKVPLSGALFWKCLPDFFFYWTRRSHLLVKEKRNRNMFFFAFMELTLHRIPCHFELTDH